MGHQFEYTDGINSDLGAAVLQPAIISPITQFTILCTAYSKSFEESLPGVHLYAQGERWDTARLYIDTTNYYGIMVPCRGLPIHRQH